MTDQTTYDHFSYRCRERLFIISLIAKTVGMSQPRNHGITLTKLVWTNYIQSERTRKKKNTAELPTTASCRSIVYNYKPGAILLACGGWGK